MLRNGDIIEIESLNPNSGRSGYELEKVIQSFGNKQPVTFEIVTNERVPGPYQNQMQYYNNGYNENRQRPMYRPQQPPYGYANGQQSFLPPNAAHQYPPQYNPYNRPHHAHHHHHQMPFDYNQQPNQNQQNGNNFVLTKQPANPNYPNFEVYTVDVTNTGTNQYPHNNNQYPNAGNDQYGMVDNPDPNTNSGDIPNHSDENKSEENINDKVDGYIDRFPVILLKENEIRR